MNRYSLWKYIVIAVALVVGVLYTLPNFFAEVPAVQVSSPKVKVEALLLGQVEDALKGANIPYRGATLDATGIKVRLADTDTQLKAKDAIQAKLGDNYIVALNLLSSSPQWLTSVGALPMYLGLDLRGGVHFLLQVDMKAALDKAGDRYSTDIRSLLRNEKIQYGGIARDGGNVVMRFKDEAERNKARAIIEKNYPDLALRDAESAGELRLIAGLKPEAQKRIQEGAVQQNIQILRNRVNELGVAEPIIQQQGSDRVVVQLPGVQDTARAKDILGRTASLEIRMVNEDPGALEAAIGGNVPFGSDLFVERGKVLAGRWSHGIDQRCQSGFDQRNNEPALHVNLDTAGARIFKGVTRDNVGQRGDRAGGERQGRSPSPPVIRRGNRRRPRPDRGAADHARSQRRRAADARGRAGGAAGNRRERLRPARRSAKRTSTRDSTRSSTASSSWPSSCVSITR
jgi:preprotein translocase subunit SecD